MSLSAGGKVLHYAAQDLYGVFGTCVCVHTYTSTDEFVGARQHKQVYATGGNGFQLHRPDVSYYFFFELKVQMNHSDAPLSSSFLCGHGCLNA